MSRYLKTLMFSLAVLLGASLTFGCGTALAGPTDTRVAFCVADATTGALYQNAPVSLQVQQPDGSWAVALSGPQYTSSSGCTSFFNIPPNQNYVVSANFSTPQCSSMQGTSAPGFGPAGGFVDLGRISAQCTSQQLPMDAGQGGRSGPGVGIPSTNFGGAPDGDPAQWVYHLVQYLVDHPGTVHLPASCPLVKAQAIENYLQSHPNVGGSVRASLIEEQRFLSGAGNEPICIATG